MKHATQIKREVRTRAAMRRRTTAAVTRERWRRQWRCFWTWPWGHAWVENEGWTLYRKHCAACGKQAVYREI